MKVLITGACAVSARSVLRSLKKSPFFSDAEFIGWDMCSLLYGLYAGVFDRMYRVPAVNDPSYEEVVRRIISEERPDVAIIVPEVEVVYWSDKDLGVPSLLPPPLFSQFAISKERLFDALGNTGLIPKSVDVSSQDIISEEFTCPLGYPVWIRDGSAGTASAKGAFKASSKEDLCAWVQINGGITHFQLSEFLPGNNYGCFCLFKDGSLVKMCQAQRIEYIMSKVAVSGITGNTSKGRLFFDPEVKRVALDAISILCAKTEEKMNGLVVVDMKCDSEGRPYVTEINLRYVAYTSIFAEAGFNVAEYHALLALGKDSELPAEVEKEFPEGNLFLRDVDGEPIFIDSLADIPVGGYYSGR
ncbi:MAG: hypothetical protein IJK48_07145 [Bacteroidales bacterium]|nr:hypothetical protein [Bacteroidales bacterium]